MSPVSSRLLAGSMIRPLRILRALISGLGSARALACIVRRLAEQKLKTRLREGAKPNTRGGCAPQKGISRSCRNSSAEIKNRHSHGETVGDLVENDALQAVRHLAVN